MKRNLSLFLSLAFLAALLSPGLSPAGTAAPLMTIRFNNDSVSYEKNLGKAVKMAQEIKPGVFFDLVAISPETENKNTNKKFDDNAKAYAAKIAEQINQSGVSPDMIRTTYQKNKLAKSNEVQIFIQ